MCLFLAIATFADLSTENCAGLILERFYFQGELIRCFCSFLFFGGRFLFSVLFISVCVCTLSKWVWFSCSILFYKNWPRYSLTCRGRINLVKQANLGRKPVSRPTTIQPDSCGPCHCHRTCHSTSVFWSIATPAVPWLTGNKGIKISVECGINVGVRFQKVDVAVSGEHACLRMNRESESRIVPASRANTILPVCTALFRN